MKVFYSLYCQFPNLDGGNGHFILSIEKDDDVSIESSVGICKCNLTPTSLDSTLLDLNEVCKELNKTFSTSRCKIPFQVLDDSLWILPINLETVISAYPLLFVRPNTPFSDSFYGENLASEKAETTDNLKKVTIRFRSTIRTAALTLKFTFTSQKNVYAYIATVDGNNTNLKNRLNEFLSSDLTQPFYTSRLFSKGLMISESNMNEIIRLQSDPNFKKKAQVLEIYQLEQEVSQHTEVTTQSNFEIESSSKPTVEPIEFENQYIPDPNIEINENSFIPFSETVITKNPTTINSQHKKSERVTILFMGDGDSKDLSLTFKLGRLDNYIASVLDYIRLGVKNRVNSSVESHFGFPPFRDGPGIFEIKISSRDMQKIIKLQSDPNFSSKVIVQPLPESEVHKQPQQSSYHQSNQPFFVPAPLENDPIEDFLQEMEPNQKKARK